MMHYDISCTNNIACTQTSASVTSCCLCLSMKKNKSLISLKEIVHLKLIAFLRGLSRPNGEQWGPVESNCITHASPQWLAWVMQLLMPAPSGWHITMTTLMACWRHSERMTKTRRQDGKDCGSQVRGSVIVHTVSFLCGQLRDIKDTPAISVPDVTFNPPWISLFSCCLFFFFFAHPRLDLFMKQLTITGITFLATIHLVTFHNSYIIML